jgi:hypothetical protein
VTLTVCRECAAEVSGDAFACPRCGAPYPARGTWSGTGFEWRSRAHLFGIPIVHVAFGRDAAGKLRVARGLIAAGQVAYGFLAIGQFAAGVVTVAQFGIGLVFGIGQFILAGVAVGQFAICLSGTGSYVLSPHGAGWPVGAPAAAQTPGGSARECGTEPGPSRGVYSCAVSSGGARLE